MSKQDYEEKLDIITAIEDGSLKSPTNIPVEVYIQESENLYHWCQADKEKLTALGLSWELVEDLPKRCGALREAESLWALERFSRVEAAREWAEESPRAYALRNELLAAFRFAFRHDPMLLGKVKTIADGETHADMIQDLNDLSLLGRENPELLNQINFDMGLLDQAAQLADQMAGLLAVFTGERVDINKTKKVRDQAFTHLKEVVDEIYAYGQYRFRSNERRLKGYRSYYLRRVRAKQARKAKEKESPNEAVPTQAQVEDEAAQASQVEATA